MKLTYPTIFCIIYCGQQADGTPGAQMPMGGGRSYCPRDDILPPPATDMIDEIGEESDHEGETQSLFTRCFPMTKTGLENVKQKVQTGIIRQCNTMKLSDIVLVVSLSITSKALLLIKMWLGYANTITL